MSSSQYDPHYSSALSSLVVVMLMYIGLSHTSAQDQYIDSLSNIVATTKDDSAKIITQIAILRHLSTTDLVRCEAAIPLTKQLLTQNKDIDIEFSGGLILAQSYFVLARHEEAHEQLEQIFPIASMVKDQSDVFYAHIIFGFLQEGVNMDTALHHMNLALSIAKKLNDPGLLGAGYSNIGNIYLGRGLVKEAEKYYTDAVAILRTGGSKNHLATAMLNLSSLTDDEKKLEDLQHEAKEIYSLLGYVHKVAEIDLNLGLRYFTKRDFKKAKQYYLIYVQFYSENEKPVTYYSALIPLGLCYLDENQPDSARIYLEEAEAYFQDDNFPSLAEALAYHEGLMKIAAAKDDYEKAYFHSWRRVQIFDSLEYSKNAEFAAEFDVRYETEKKEKQLIAQRLQLEKEKNKRSRTLLISLGALALLTLIGGWYFFALRRRKQETQHQMDLQAIESDALKELNKMKSRWFENISHDIRTPLTLISAPIKDLLNTTKSVSAQELLQIADRNSQHLLQLTNEMLELARLENNVIPLRPVTKNAFDEINKTVHAFDSYAAEKKVTIIASIDIAPTAYFTFDFDKYEKVFNNLFKNAIIYSPPNTEVNVNVIINNGQLHTAIKDHGPGIPPDEIPLLFDKYFRASHQQSTQIEGSGLGLSIVQELLSIMKGSIDVKSEIGSGSVFSFAIPIQLADRVAEQAILPTNEQDDIVVPISLLGDRRMSLLVVEDNTEMSNYLKTVLSSEYSVETAMNGNIALQKLADNMYDLIISDIMMPGMDGFTFKQQVNTLTQHGRTPFIFLSAKSLDDDRLRGLRLGIDDYITKPFVTEELKIRIRNILSRKLIRDEMDHSTESEEQASISDENNIIDQAQKIVFEQLSDPAFGVEQLAEGLHYSSRQLNRILKKHTGMTSVQFILELRLQRARSLLLDGQLYSVKEVQHEVGIQSQSYFSRKYTERFGCSPGSHVV